MADAKISALTALSAVPAAADLIPLVDVSDTSMAASGTTKHALFDYLIRLRLSSESITTGNATVAVNTHHLLDVSGMTANRNFTLPSGTAGDQIRVTLGVGDATYALILIGDTGVSINGGSAATEWSRIFITGETVTFLCTAANAWWVILDGRIPQKGNIERNTDQTGVVTATWTKVAVNSTVLDVGGICDPTTNNRITIRRAGHYLVHPFVNFTSMPDNSSDIAAVYKNGSLLQQIFRCFVATSTTRTAYAGGPFYAVNCVASDYFEAYAYQDSGSNKTIDSTSGNRAFLVVIEDLKKV